MNLDDPMQKLIDLAAMRLLHAMPVDEALRKFTEIYGDIDKETLFERRARAIATFQKTFGTDEEPESGPLCETPKNASGR